MNKKTVIKIKKAINYEGLPEQKRLLKTFIKGYQSIPHTHKREYLNKITSMFNEK